MVTSTSDTEIARVRPDLPFRALMTIAVLLGLLVRVLFVSLANLPSPPGDALFFRLAGSNLANGKGYSAPFATDPHKLVASAVHPPLFGFLLAFFDLLGIQSVSAQRLALACVTCSSVLILGLLGRKMAGPTVGIIAAFIAAVNPLWLGLVGSLLSESIYLVIIPGMLLLALRCLERPSVGRFVALGVAIALATLTRSEAIDFVVFLGVPVLLFAAVPWKRRGLLALSLLVGVVALVGPWLIRNEVQVGGAVLSTDKGGTLAGSYCADTFNPASPYYGAFSGLYATALAASIITYEKPPDPKTGWNQLSVDSALTKAAETYARHHIGQIPRVVVAREAATWGLDYSNEILTAHSEGRTKTGEQMSIVLYWLLIPFVLIGGVALARSSWRRLVIIAVPIVVVAINVAITYGSTRFRVAAEPSLTVLAAVGILAVVRRLRPDSRDRGAFGSVGVSG